MLRSHHSEHRVDTRVAFACMLWEQDPVEFGRTNHVLESQRLKSIGRFDNERRTRVVDDTGE